MANMLVFVDAIIPSLVEEKLRALVDMCVCVSSASYMLTPAALPISPDAQTILDEIGRSLLRKVFSLREAISSTMEEVRTLVEDDDSWAILIPRGRGEVHRNTRLMLDCIMHMVKAEVSLRNSADLGGLINDSVQYLKDLLLRKSELCLDPGLRYLFLLNNFYSVAQLSQPWLGDHARVLGLAPECKKFMDSYLDVSWGHVMSHIQETAFVHRCLDVSCGPVMFYIHKRGLHGWHKHLKNLSLLAKFDSAFHQTCQAQKFWKVPVPLLRDTLRKAITERVISGYRHYLKKHPELEKHISSDRTISAEGYWNFRKKHPELEKYISGSPDVLKGTLAELFER